MSERKWLAGKDPEIMQKLLGRKASTRKLRLFACACCLRISDLIPTQASLECVLISERDADGLAANEELQGAIAASIAECAQERERRRETTPWSLVEVQAINAVSRVHQANGAGAENAAASARAWAHCMKKAHAGDKRYVVDSDEYSSQALEQTFRLARSAETALQVEMLRDIFGNPFRPVTVDPTWLASNNGTVRKLAQAIYDERAFDRVPILADALEDAGCTNQDILSHCRSSAEHIRGCWVVDLLVDKS